MSDPYDRRRLAEHVLDCITPALLAHYRAAGWREDDDIPTPRPETGDTLTPAERHKAAADWPEDAA